MAYQKHNFVDGEVLYAQQLNTIQEQVYSNEAKIEEIEGSVTDQGTAIDEIKDDVDDLKAAIDQTQESGISAVNVDKDFVPTANGDGTWEWKQQQGGGGNGDIVFLPDNIVTFEEVDDDFGYDEVISEIIANKLSLQSDGQYIFMMYGENEISRVELPAGGSDGVFCTGISIDQQDLKIDIDDEKSYILTATVEPFDCTQPVKWNSSNKNTVTVDEYGKLSIVGIGSTLITAKCGTKSATVTIEITNNVLTGWGIRRGYALDASSSTWKIYSQGNRAYLYYGDTQSLLPVSSNSIMVVIDDIHEAFSDLNGVALNYMFYDANKNRISSSGWLGWDESYRKRTIAVPDNAAGMSFNVIFWDTVDHGLTISQGHQDWLEAHMRIKEVDG